MKTAVIYARYSSEKQTEQSIEGQIRVCEQFAKTNDIRIVGKYIDRAMTGTNDLRPDFQRMIRDSASKQWDYVLVYKLDRFSRDKYETIIHKHTLKVNGVKVLSAMENIPDSPEGIILESLLEGMNQYYSAELAQKVKRGMRESRLKGNFTGGTIIYGYKVENKKVSINEDEACIVRYIFEQYALNRYVKDIIEDLNKKHIYNRNRPFTRSFVYKMLANEKYSGILKHDNEIHDNIYPKLISDEIFDIVRKKIYENRHGKHDQNVVYLLKNKVRCGYCGKTISSESGTSRNGTTHRYYKCLSRKKGENCKKTPIQKEIFEKIINETTFKIFKPSNINLLADQIVERNKTKTVNPEINILEKEKADTQTAINNLIKCMEQGIVSSSTKNRLEQLEQKLQDIEISLSKEKSKEQIYITRDDIIKFIKTSLKKEPALLYKLLIKEIILYDDKIEIYYNYIEKKKMPDKENQAFCIYKGEFETYIDEHKIKTESIKFNIKVYGFI